MPADNIRYVILRISLDINSQDLLPRLKIADDSHCSPYFFFVCAFMMTQYRPFLSASSIFGGDYVRDIRDGQLSRRRNPGE
jgi:hypothetical protein